MSLASTDERDTSQACIAADSVSLVERKMRGPIQAVRQDIVPFERCNAKNLKVSFSLVWPAGFSFPRPLSQLIDRSNFSDVALKCVQTLLLPSDVDAALSATLEAHIVGHIAYPFERMHGNKTTLLSMRTCLKEGTPCSVM